MTSSPTSAPGRLRDLMSTMGTGPRSSEPLTYGQARSAMDQLLGDPPPVTFGGFLVAQRWKGEEVEELAGFLDELRSGSVRFFDPGLDRHLDVAGRFDGKLKTPNTDWPANLLAAAAGLPVFVHGGQDVPTKPGGVTFLDVLEEWGWEPRPSLETSRRSLEELGFGYAHQATYSPELEALRGYRSELGVRSFFNTLESMVNPSRAPIHLGSFYHLPYAKRVCEVYDRCEVTSPSSVVMVQGIEGQPEVRPRSCVVARWRKGQLTDRTVESEQLGVDFRREKLENIGSAPSVSADLARDLLTGGSVPEPYRHSVLLNGAVRLWAGEDVETVAAGVERMRTTLANSAPARLLKELEEVYRRE